MKFIKNFYFKLKKAKYNHKVMKYSPEKNISEQITNKKIGLILHVLSNLLYFLAYYYC